MAAEQTEGKAMEKPGSSEAPDLKRKAQEVIGGGPRGTSSWAILKDLHMSIIDGGVSILKQGLSRLTGAVCGPNFGTGEKPSAVPEDSGALSGLVIGTSAKADSGMPGEDEPCVTGARDSGQDEPAAFGVDWIDDLLEELDSSILTPGGAQKSESSLAQRDTQGSGGLQSSDKNPVVTKDANHGSIEQTTEHPGF